MFRQEFVGITDYEGNDIHEGDIIKWRNQKELGVVRYEPYGCQFRIQFDPKTNIPSCHIGINTGKKAKGIKIGSVYNDDSLVPWAYER